MRQTLHEFRSFFRKGDMILLALCLALTTFGYVMIASATNYMGNTRFIIMQLLATLLGVGLYAAVSSIDVTIMSEHRIVLVIFNCLLLSMLIPFGTDNNTGNRSWLEFPFLPFDVQPAEICKITFIVIMASVMTSHQSKLSSMKSVFHMCFHLGLLFGLNMVLSKDAGVSLIFAFIFIGMAFAGGVSLLWFLLAGGLLTAAAPILWNFILSPHQKNRIEVLFNPALDPLGVDERYHTVRSLRSLTGGGWTGQGLFEGTRTQNGELFAQHTDYIYSAIGEELGFIGCILVLIALLLIIVRCIRVGNRSQDFMRKLVCYGAAAALIFQVVSNVGMCIGITPVIGLTLPFVSYGGSSILSLYAMLGLVSGVHARPSAPSHERYIRPPLESTRKNRF